MIKAAIEYLYNLGSALDPVATVDGRNYDKRDMSPVMEPCPAVIEMHTLAGLVEYRKAIMEQEAGGRKVVFCAAWDRVSLVTEAAGPFKQRFPLAVATPGINDHFPSGMYLDLEQFIINVQVYFDSDYSPVGCDKGKVLKLAGNIRDEAISTSVDDGVAQTVAVKTGIARVTEKKVSNPFTLRPFRTFTDIEQPSSSYILRFKRDEKGGIKAGLWEVGDPSWRVECAEEIKKFLTSKLPEIPVLV